MRDQERGDIVPVEDIVQIDRRNRLLRQFKDTPVVYTLDDFLSNIGLLDAYDTFVGSANAVNLFESLAQAAPYLDGTKLKTTEDQEDNETAKSFVASKKSDEAALMAYFFVLCRKMAAEARKARAESAPNYDIPQQIYSLADHQGSAVPGSPHKPDGVVYYTKRTVKDIHAVHMCVKAKIAPTPDVIPDVTMGQILDYMNALWVNQPTRTFAPVLYVHGKLLTLFVFTCGPWYRIELGKFCYASASPGVPAMESVRDTLLSLWFIMTLPAHKFGHFCDIDIDSQCIQFNHADDGGSVLKDVIMPLSDSPNALSLESRIPRTVNPRSRLAYLFDTT
ncbi:hypothetical protein GGI23_005423, partial [Coemansia sp. RSA 2559]